ncbi:MAG: RNA-binding cell elongation regulator Jag/EloR [Elusimicrobiota bacterium]|nr:RNA-binding cell elongation regulator Jag/EloR [Elusimicrobiota bacterium]
MSNKREFKGKSVEAAIEKGLKKMGLEKKSVEVEILDEGKAGLFGLMGAEPAKVKLKTKEGVRTRTNIDWEYTLKRAEKLAGLLIKSIDDKAAYKVEKGESAVSVNVQSDESAVLIGKGGDTLNVLEYIFNLMMKKDPDSRVSVNLDVEGYKKEKVDKLIKKAKEAAKNVKKTGESEELPPMTSKERKKVHNAINGIEGVDTESRGKGRERRILVKEEK